MLIILFFHHIIRSLRPKLNIAEKQKNSIFLQGVKVLKKIKNYNIL